MNEKVVDLHTATAPEKTEKKARTVRLKVDPVLPSHIVEVWRLVEASIRDGGQNYPDTTEDNAEVIRSHLFQYLQRPTFMGLIARIGKRPVGVILGHVDARPFGRPSRYAYIHCIWIDPGQRKHGFGKALWDQYASKLKASGIYNWESAAHDKLMKQIERADGVPIHRLMSIIGGKL